MLLTILALTGCGDYSSDHIDADDNGEGKSIRLIVKPDDSNGLIIRDQNNNMSSKWHDTGLIVNSFPDENGQISIGISIRGSWYPFGSSGKKRECSLTTCANTPDIRCNNLPSNTPVVDMSDSNIGCYLSQGKGIYILIAKSGGTTPDPNANPTVANSPGSYSGFYTAHLGDFKTNKNGLISVDKVWSCDDNSSVIACNEVKISQLVGGKIYLKPYDGYYSDNTADLKDSSGNPYVLINLKSGIVYPNFVSETITTIVNNINDVSDRLENSIVTSLRDLTIVIVMMYLTFTAFAFMIGMAKITQTEAVVRLLKVGIVLMFLTPDNIIANGFMHMYQQLANFGSNIIAGSMPNSYIDTSGGSDLESSLNYLLMYDEIINQILSRQVHIKIISLLFTWNFWLIPFMYILIVMIIFIVLRSLLLYITAYVQIAFLIVILPILVPTLLFNTTADIFQNWLKYMANSALLIIVATTGFGVVLNIMMDNLGNLLSYSVTKTWWWFPDDDDAVSSVLNFSTYISTLIQALICYGFVEVAPKLADALSESQLSPSLHAFNALWNGMSNMLNEGISKLKSFNNQYLMGKLMDQSYKTDGKYDRSKEGKGLLNDWRQKRDKINKFYERKIGRKIDMLNRKINDDSLINLIDPYKDQKIKDELADLREKHELEGKTYSDYRELINKKREEYTNQVKDNLSRINEVIMPDNSIVQLDDPRDTINYQGQDIQKQEIREAIAEGRSIKNANGDDLGQVQNNPRAGAANQYDVGLNDSLKGKLTGLAKIEKDYGFVKRK